jgi:hypothetical protein
MKILKALAIVSTILVTPVLTSATGICTNCEMAGLPSSSIKTIEKLAKNTILNNKKVLKNRSVASIEGDAQWAAYRRNCILFETAQKEDISTIIKDMENSPYSADSYFQHSECSPSMYSDSVKSPMIHYVAEDLFNRQDFLRVIWLYYSKKRKEPGLFTQAVNIKNTKGETLLDYIETLKQRDTYSDNAKNGPLINIVNMICEHGGEYSTHKEKKCP